MTTAEKKITLNGIDMLTLLGVNDANLNILEDRFNSTISVRGEIVNIKGVLEEVELVEKVIKEMVYVLNTSGRLNRNDVETILNLTVEGKEIINEEDFDSIVLYTKNDVVKAKTPGQKQYFQVASKNDICFAIGPAGTGKTYLAVACAVDALLHEKVRKIILVRPAVEAGEKLGFLPGDMAQKVDPYLRPLYDALYEMLGFERVEKMLEKGMIEVAPLAFMRGRTLNDAFIILDEAQNTTLEQIKMFLTRVGFGSTAVITGDVTQIDLPSSKMSGLQHVLEV